MKAVVAAFNQEKALVGAFSVITNLQMQFGCNFLKHYWPLLTYGVCGLAVLHHVQAPDLVCGVHAELADGLHRAQGVAA